MSTQESQKHTPGPWRTGITLMTNMTSKWSRSEIDANNDIELRTVFANFSSKDSGRSRRRICFCETKEDAQFIASAPLLRELLERVIELGITADHAKNTHKLNSIIQEAKRLIQ